MQRPRVFRRALAALALFCTALLPFPARAGDNPAEALEFEEIDVVGTAPVAGLGTPLDDAAANVQIHRAKEIARQRPDSAADFLFHNGASVTVADGQGNPYQPDVSFRGFTASPLLGTPQGLSVFLDGVRANEPFGDVVNWDLIPPGAISRIQVIPGSTPALGLNTLGGAVAIYTKSGASSPGLALDADGGSFWRRGLSLEAGAARGDYDVFVAGNFQQDDGWADHNPSRVGQLFAKVGRQTADTDLDLSVLLADTALEGTQTLPRSWLDDPRQAYTFPDRNLNRLVHAHLSGSALLAKDVLLGGSLYVRRLSSDNVASNVNSADDPADPASPQATLDRALTATVGCGGALQLTLTRSLLGHRNQLSAGAAADLGDARFHQESQPASFTADRGTVATGDFASNTDLETTTRTLGLYATDTFAIARGLSLTVSGRFNNAQVKTRNRGDPADDALNGDHSFNRLNPAAGLAWTPRRSLTAYATYNEGMRVPTPMELTCADPAAPCKLPNAFLADPALKRVVSRTVELGARGSLGAGFRWNAAIYRTLLDDDIQFISDPRSGVVTAGYFANVGQTRRQGFECGLGAKAGPVSFNLAYGFVDATFQTPYPYASSVNSSAVDADGDGVRDTVQVRAGDHLPGIPAHSGKLRVDWEVAPHMSVGASLALASGTWARGDENNRDANGMVPGYATAGLDASWQFVKGFSLGVKVSNLLDSRYSNFGLLGQNAFTGPSRTFGPSVGVAPAVEQFRSIAAPRGAWVSLSYSLDGKGTAKASDD